MGPMFINLAVAIVIILIAKSGDLTGEAVASALSKLRPAWAGVMLVTPRPRP